MGDRPAPEAEAPRPDLPPGELEAIEAAALQLARSAGETIMAALGSRLSVEYKTAGKGTAQPTDPVSEIDRAVEDAIRERLAGDFPGHAIIGEEVDEHPAAGSGYAWAIDPVDGTTNFINGFPLFSASIGVLHDGVPVAGATWCSTSRELRPGVYHAHHGGALHFEGVAIAPLEPNDTIRRPLAAAPGGSPGRTAHWDNRVTGSAAIECVFTAAGIFTSARFGGLRIWDMASGVCLARAAGLDIMVRRGGAWQPFDRFEAPRRVKEDREPTLRDWSEPLLLGTPEAVRLLLERRGGDGLWRALRRRFSRGEG